MWVARLSERVCERVYKPVNSTQPVAPLTAFARVLASAPEQTDLTDTGESVWFLQGDSYSWSVHGVKVAMGTLKPKVDPKSLCKF